MESPGTVGAIIAPTEWRTPFFITHCTLAAALIVGAGGVGFGRERRATQSVYHNADAGEESTREIGDPARDAGLLRERCCRDQG
jgi:hypothetical protein